MNTNKMEGGKGAALGRREQYFDPVKAQGTLAALNKKEREMRKRWTENWGFYKDMSKICEEEAEKLGLSREEYITAVKSVSCVPPPAKYSVKVDPSPKPLPKTSTGMIGHRARCTIEQYGRLVKTSRDYPLKPPMPPGQIYDPYKQTMVYIGIEGDPISFKLPPATENIPEEVLNREHQVEVSHLTNYFLKSTQQARAKQKDRERKHEL